MFLPYLNRLLDHFPMDVQFQNYFIVFFLASKGVCVPLSVNRKAFLATKAYFSYCRVETINPGRIV